VKESARAVTQLCPNSVARIFLIGCSGHASVVLDVIEKEGINSVVGIIDSYAKPDAEILGSRVLGTELDLPQFMAQYDVGAGVVAIGDNFTRHLMVEKIRSISESFAFVSTIHPSAQIGRGVQIGSGTVLMAGAIVNPNSSIGEHCILNTATSIDHDNVIERFCSIAPGVNTGGNVKLGEFSVLSLRSGVIHGCAIGKHTVVGAGATVLSDLPDYVVAYGTPARVIRSRKPGEKYL
jgi:sugar O-acyltransferase (sialic acid O-acetyltransferase NeuD family)